MDARSRSVYLPAGGWYDFFANTRYDGGRSVTWSASDSTKIPVFVREGGIVPMLLDGADTLVDRAYLPGTSTLATDTGALLFRVFPHGDSSFSVYDGTTLASSMPMDGSSVKLTLTSTTRSIRFEVLMSVTVRIVVRDGSALHLARSAAELDSGIEGWIQNGDVVDVRIHHGGGSTEILISSSDQPSLDASTGDGSSIAHIDAQSLDDASPAGNETGAIPAPGKNPGGCSCETDRARNRARRAGAGEHSAWALALLLAVCGRRYRMKRRCSARIRS
jgi:hypothetical protein